MLQSEPYKDYENDIKSLDYSYSHYEYPNSNHKVEPLVTPQKENSGNSFNTRLFLSCNSEIVISISF